MSQSPVLISDSTTPKQTALCDKAAEILGWPHHRNLRDTLDRIYGREGWQFNYALIVDGKAALSKNDNDKCLMGMSEGSAVVALYPREASYVDQMKLMDTHRIKLLFPQQLGAEELAKGSCWGSS